MKIKVLGTRGEIKVSAPYHAKKSGVLIDDTLLLDVGEKRFLDYDPRAILITHLHPDHAYFVRKNELPETDIPMHAPEQYQRIMHLTKAKFKVDGCTITPIPTIHSAKVKSNAYLIVSKGVRILYTGDMIWIKKKYHPLLRNLDLVITEASYSHHGGLIRRDEHTGKIFGHTGVPNLVRLFKRFTHNILFIHFGSWFYKDMKASHRYFKQLAKENELNIIVGYDGLEVEVV